MEKLPCSIFNDVLGPVMRGPSSSHVAGAGADRLHDPAISGCTGEKSDC